MYKAQKDQVQVFGLRTQFGGGKTTGFALIYDSPEAMKKFEPIYRLVRVGMATKAERASRQQRKWSVLRVRRTTPQGQVKDWLLTSGSGIQASSARTDKRPCAARRRSRVPRRRRRNKRIAHRCKIGGRVCGMERLAGDGDGARPCPWLLACLWYMRNFVYEPLGKRLGKLGVTASMVCLQYTSMKSRCLSGFGPNKTKNVL